MRRAMWLAGCAVLVAGLGRQAQSQELFSKTVGDVRVKAVKQSATVEVPFIIWGGDVATLHANGGLTTKQGSIFQKQGLNLKLTPGDDYVAQVRRYLAGDSPFLRGTMRMIGLASEVVGSDPRTKPVVFLQLTWSAGDHLVGREGLATLDQLKGKKVALQKAGPHVGMLDDILRLAKLTWGDITPVWCDDLTGAKGPAERFRQDASIDACTVITPDMLGLTGGLESQGSGAEGTIKGAHVVISTASLSRSIADVYACRKDYYDANKATIEKFVAGYLKGCEEIVALKNEFEDKGSSAKYMEVLKLAQSVYGKEVLPTLEADAHGLIADATMVGLPGNASFFLDKGNLNNFERKQAAALDLAVGQGYAKVRAGFFGPDFDYAKIKQLGGLAGEATVATSEGRFDPELVEGFSDPELDENTLLSFTIAFEPNQEAFGVEVYGPEFQRVLEQASTVGNAVVAIRGHADPTKVLFDLVKAGMAKGVLKRTGTPGNYKYTLDGRPLDLTQTEKIVELIEQGEFVGGGVNPLETMQAALNLSRQRAEAVKKAIVEYAAAQGLNLDETQVQPVGVGVRDPVIPKPTNLEEAKQNMRVEFRLLRVPAEAVNVGEFDF